MGEAICDCTGGYDTNSTTAKVPQALNQN